MLRHNVLRAFFLASVVIATSGANCGSRVEPPSPLPPAPDRIVAVTVEPQVVELLAGQERQLRATVMGHPDNIQQVSQEVRWTTSAPNAVSVSTTGVVRALAVGSSVLTATSVGDTTKQGTAVVVVGRTPAL